MRAYKIKVIATKSVVITEDMWKEEGMRPADFNEFTASQFAKGILIEEMTNDPNRVTVYVKELRNYGKDNHNRD